MGPVLIAFRSRSAMRELGVRNALGVTFPVTSRFDAAQFVSGVVVINASAHWRRGSIAPRRWGRWSSTSSATRWGSATSSIRSS